jgi:hypothetical protein
MTVFFLTDHPSSSGDNLILVDAIALYPDESAPAAIAAPPPTDTPAPTATPEPVQEAAPAELAAAAAPVDAAVDAQPAAIEVPPTETPTPTPTATPLPTDTPTATPSPTPTATWTPLPTATWTPWPTVTPGSPLDTEVLQARVRTNARTVSGGLVLLGSMSFGGALIFGLMLGLLRRKR